MPMVITSLAVNTIMARLYDPVIGRWKAIDPMAKKSGTLSTYNYVENNPVRNTDPYEKIATNLAIAFFGPNSAIALAKNLYAR
jgi:uncharacterized protein RhaS with RHS repeats